MGPDDLRVTDSLTIPQGELSWRFSRSSGPGGQSVNTTDSRAEVLFDVMRSPSLTESLRARALERLGTRLVDGVLAVSPAQERSQLQNRRVAQQQLARVLAEAVAPPPRRRRATRPSRSSVERRLVGKRQRSHTKRMRRSTDD